MLEIRIFGNRFDVTKCLFFVSKINKMDITECLKLSKTHPKSSNTPVLSDIFRKKRF